MYLFLRLLPDEVMKCMGSHSIHLQTCIKDAANWIEYDWIEINESNVNELKQIIEIAALVDYGGYIPAKTTKKE